MLVCNEVYGTNCIYWSLWNNNLGFGANDIPQENTGEDKEKELVW